MALEGSSAAQSTVDLDETNSTTQEEIQPTINTIKNSNEKPAYALSVDVLSTRVETPQEEDSDTTFSHPLFGSYSTSSLLIRMTKPESQDIRKWMAQTQETVNTEISSWQHMLIRNTAHVSALLDQLIQFLICLDGNVYGKHSTIDNNDPPSTSMHSSFLLTAKYPNDNGTLESAINVYLHVITLVITQLRNSMDSEKNNSKHHRQLIIQLLQDFSLVAEDALKLFRTHEKYLLPIRSRVVEMRNDFFVYLRPLISNPLVGIIPLANMSLEKIHLVEDAKWLKRLEQYSNPARHNNYFPYVKVRVGSKDCVITKLGGDRETTLDETTTAEKLEVVQLFLKQLSVSFVTSNLECQDSQYLSEICTKLARRFEELIRGRKSLESETRKCRLKSDTCCSVLKHSLCHLEVKFHQVERILEEIPEHIRKVIGVADYCTRQLVVDLGHTPTQQQPQIPENHEELFVPPEWATSIETVSKEFFRPKVSLMGCFPILWKLVAKILGGGGNQSRRKLKEFWEQVRTEVEDFQKEMKVKEMDANYSFTLAVPVFQHESTSIKVGPMEMMNNEVVVNKLASEDEDIGQQSTTTTAHAELNNESTYESKHLGESNANYDNTTQVSASPFTVDFATNNVQNKIE